MLCYIINTLKRRSRIAEKCFSTSSDLYPGKKEKAAFKAAFSMFYVTKNRLQVFLQAVNLFFYIRMV